MLSFTQLSIRVGPRALIENSTFTIHRGHKVGITGANGTGKTTLLSLILGQITPDAGDFDIPKQLVIAHVAQEVDGTERSAVDYVIDGDIELRQLQQKLAACTDDGIRQAELHSAIEQAGGYTAEARAATLMHGLGFEATQVALPVNHFSGGWRMRLNLARALMCRSDLLLLDEPTNHLDLDAVIWLESWLKHYEGTLLLISHDREFLDNVVNEVAHIEHLAIKLYGGNYSQFERIRAEHLAAQQASHEKQQREIAHMNSYITRFRAKATKAKQAQSRLKALSRLQLIAPAHIDSPFSFQFKKPDKLPNPLVRITDASVGYDAPLLKQIKLEIHNDARIGLLGPNGAGKSTFIKLIADELEAMTGELHFAKDTKIAYFAQHQLDQLTATASPIEHLQQIDKKATDAELRTFLGGFGFQGDRVFEPVKPFSGGEKARLVLAMLVYQKPNLLLLDEPSNHLDIQMRHALTVALQDFAGAIVLISHDRHLLRMACDTLLLVNDGRVQPYEGDIDSYPSWLQQRHKPGNGDTKPKVTERDQKEKKRKEAELRQQLAPLRKEVTSLEKQLDRLNGKKQALEAQLSDETLYEEANKDKLKELLWQQADLSKSIDLVEEEWMEKAEALEQAKSAASGQA
jgi:ATP-binding cassette subfamily F protein 3